MARITARPASESAVLCGLCGLSAAMASYWLCDDCASVEEHALERAEFHSERADDLRGAGRMEATRAADQADRWAGAIAGEWSR